MKPRILLISFVFSINVFSQNDTTMIRDTAIVNVDSDLSNSDGHQPVKVFYGQRLINSNTVEVLRKGVMEFRVIHNFGDIAGKAGGIDNFFGLDGASDVKIGFQVGVGNRLNILAARTRGDQSSSGDTSGSRFVSGNFIRVGSVQQLWELGLKYQFMK